jgi:Putative zinc-finger
MICGEWLRAAKQGMGKPMGNRECVWVGARLPLWVDSDDRDVPAQAHGDGTDLTARERRQIERHLVDCARCRDHQMALGQALGTLAVAATQLPVLPEAPSLWPLLERRIANRDVHASGRWPRLVGVLAGRSISHWGNLDSVRPLRQAWTHDTLREVFGGRNQLESESKRFSGLVLKMSVAAAVLVALTGISVARRQWKNAQSTILTNAVPLADPVPVPIMTEEAPLNIAERDEIDVPANQLAEADPPRPVESHTSGIDAAAAPKPSPNTTRFGFDLEHGTPMPPDTRDAKPVY